MRCRGDAIQSHKRRNLCDVDYTARGVLGSFVVVLVLANRSPAGLDRCRVSGCRR